MIDLHDVEMTARFLAKVERDPATGCLNWTAARNGAGFGVFTVAGRQVLARRLAYEAARGDIPDGYRLSAECSRQCVNPEHLRAVPPGETQRGIPKPNQSARSD